ncbi:MAG TPA: RNA polymerase sigma factor [Ramlibacter sp.]|jgi:RNA polymerase sigma-70 factor (ECF subfamily)|nr:RNA polymerase sigma factor [Ramlibacter sp.]
MNAAASVPQGIADAELAARIASGDGAAFELLMRRHNRRLYRIARSVLRNGADAEDALQESYLAVYRGIGSFRGDSSLATWLAKLVLNHCLGRKRKALRRENIVAIVPEDPENESIAPIDIDTPDRALIRAELRELLESKVEQLPEAFRTVFMMRCVEELSVEETADLLAIPQATVRTRHFRARSLLRESLAQDIDVAEQDLFGFDGERCDRIVARVLGAVIH